MTSSRKEELDLVPVIRHLAICENLCEIRASGEKCRAESRIGFEAAGGIPIPLFYYVKSVTNFEVTEGKQD